MCFCILSLGMASVFGEMLCSGGGGGHGGYEGCVERDVEW